jgi:RNA polymerase sigma factor (TIGR02999 family)
MKDRETKTVTELLQKWSNGQAGAGQLIPLVYADLRIVARKCLRREEQNHFISTRTLVHEAYFRLIDCATLRCQDRNHFLSIAAIVMRRVLVEEARKRNSQKRGGARSCLNLDEAMIVSPRQDQELMALHEALERLEQQFPRKGRVVELRYFAGLTIEETAEALGISADIVKREWRTAKLWLRRELLNTGGSENGSGTSTAD